MVDTANFHVSQRFDGEVANTSSLEAISIWVHLKGVLWPSNKWSSMMDFWCYGIAKRDGWLDEELIQCLGRACKSWSQQHQTSAHRLWTGKAKLCYLPLLKLNIPHPPKSLSAYMCTNLIFDNLLGINELDKHRPLAQWLLLINLLIITFLFGNT